MTNKRNTRTLEFDVMDAPAILHALRIGATTAMMVGGPAARKALDAYAKIVDAMVPTAAKLFQEETWSEFGIAMLSQKEFKVFVGPVSWDIDREKYWSSYSTGPIWVQFGNLRWATQNWNYKQDGPEVKLIFDALTECAPVDCVGSIVAWVPKPKLEEPSTE